MPLLNRLFFAEKRKLYFKEQFTTPTLSDDGLSYKHDADTWYYGNGKNYQQQNQCEYIYFHFMIYKKIVSGKAVFGPTVIIMFPVRSLQMI
jgi:hypothetical protein